MIENPGEEVYAVGSLLGKEFAFSVTKGVVSAIRRGKGLDYIQSDVLVLPGSSGGPLLDAAGNVVGVTEAGVELFGVPAGMNFFAPARDIFSALALVDKNAR
ncbi:MAG: serine protease [Gammaproteobacteria bacterium]|nr:serine protease [Gammaproteobacteria bacterium]